MKRFGVVCVVAVFCLTGCFHLSWPHFSWPKFKPKPKPPTGPQVITESKGPLSIVVSPFLGWAAAPAAAGTPVYIDTDDIITAFPPTLEHTLIIQRRGLGKTDLGYLNGQVRVPTDATLYVALLVETNGEVQIPKQALTDFQSEGWHPIDELFAITQPADAHEKWLLFSHVILRGPVTILSDAVPNGGIFFIGRLH